MLNYLEVKKVGEGAPTVRLLDVLNDVNSDIAGLACIVGSMSQDYAEDGRDLSLIGQALDLMHAALSNVLEVMEPGSAEALDRAEVGRQAGEVMECAAALERMADEGQSDEIARLSDKLDGISKELARIADANAD